MNVRLRWEAAARLVAHHRDVLDGRPTGDDPPPALVTRDWASFLLARDDGCLERLEAEGADAIWPRDTPASLAALIAEVREVCGVPALLPPLPAGVAHRRETPRKRAQVEAFAHVVMPLAARAQRVVDVGSGHGHLTRAIAERIAVPVVGLERDLALADRARALTGREDHAAPSPTFAQTDVLRDGLGLEAGDCAIGLHACGELGDAMVLGVARSAAAIALVGCCLQKRRARSRAPLADVTALGLGEALELPRDLLGLSNLTARDAGVEATRSENLAARERRLALHRLLSADGRVLRPGEEIEGLNRRAAHGDLPSLVERAFARCQRTAPSRVAIAEAAAWARAQHARSRRLSLPRALLARALEVFVLMDRARHLQASGFAVTVGTLFAQSVSARNLALLAQRG